MTDKKLTLEEMGRVLNERELRYDFHRPYETDVLDCEVALQRARVGLSQAKRHLEDCERDLMLAEGRLDDAQEYTSQGKKYELTAAETLSLSKAINP